MEIFSGDWLALRGAADRAARSRILAAQFVTALPPNPSVLDLASGGGANAKYLETETTWSAPGAAPNWTLVDGDAGLLAQVQGLKGLVELRTADLSSGVSRDPKARVDGVTASAFFDLVSADWFEAFARGVRGVPLLLALTIDGRWRWSPAHDHDNDIMALFARDQRRDKGFGPAMAGGAAMAMIRILNAQGFTVSSRRADWRLGAADTALLEALIQNIAAAMAPYGVDASEWLICRRQQVAQGGLRLRLGHLDLFARPALSPDGEAP
jgi:hypothetical protein